MADIGQVCSLFTDNMAFLDNLPHRYTKPFSKHSVRAHADRSHTDVLNYMRWLASVRKTKMHYLRLYLRI